MQNYTSGNAKEEVKYIQKKTYKGRVKREKGKRTKQEVKREKGAKVRNGKSMKPSTRRPCLFLCGHLIEDGQQGWLTRKVHRSGR